MDSRRFLLKELMVVLSFINGFFSAIGFTPQARLFDFIRPFIESLPFIGKFLFASLPLAVLIYSGIKVYRKGRFTGLFAVAIGFMAGLTFPSDILAGVVIFAFSLALGYFAFRKR